MSIEVAFLNSERDNAPIARALEWEDLAAVLTTHARRPEKSGPAWVPAKIEGRRSNENTRAVTVAVFDLDERAPGEPITPEDFDRVLGAIDSSGLAAVVHSTHRHAPAKPKARVAVRLSRAVLPNEWRAVRSALEARLGLYADPSTKDLARLYYLPSAPPDAAVFAAATEGGTPADVDEILRGARTEALTAVAAPLAAEALDAAKRAARAATSEPVDLTVLRRVLATTRGQNAALLKRAVKGEAIAAEGNRDDTLQKICAAARFALPPATPSEAILEVFRESIEKIPRLALPGGGLEDWWECAREKLERSQERRIASDAARAAGTLEQNARMRAEVAALLLPPRSHMPTSNDAPGSTAEPELDASLEDAGEYSEEDLATWASEHGCPDVLSFQHRWIITRADSYYCFVQGVYRAPIPRQNLDHSLARDFSRAPIRLYNPGTDGNPKRRPATEILHDYSTVARSVEASLVLQASRYDARSQCFHEATTPLRRLQPRWHEEVDRWLALLDSSGRLSDWVAVASRLDRQACAVYLDGPGGIGKTLLATGLARLWTTGGPSELMRVLDGFNESLIQCPLVLADEAIPARKGITAELRRFIGSTKRTLNRKYLPAAPLEGAIRLIIAGNNDRLLDTGEELSTADLEAVASRIYYLKSDARPAEYLKQIGGPRVLQRWIDGDMIAEHSLYLRGNRRVNEGARFLVEGNPGEFHQHLATGSGISGLVCEWLARYLADAAPAPSPFVLTGEGEVWVNTDALAKVTSWERYVPSAKVPSAAALGRALRSLSIGSAEPMVAGRTTSYHRIDPDLVLSWVERLRIGDPYSVKSKIEAKNTTIAAELVREAGAIETRKDRV